ncbi:MAG: hypothetical protein QM695_10620 [Micropruina sp.]
MITITPHPWLGGWELRRDGDPITQVRTLDKARRQVIDYYDTVEAGTDHSSWEIVIVPESGTLSEASGVRNGRVEHPTVGE